MSDIKISVNVYSRQPHSDRLARADRYAERAQQSRAGASTNSAIESRIIRLGVSREYLHREMLDRRAVPRSRKHDDSARAFRPGRLLPVL